MRAAGSHCNISMCGRPYSHRFLLFTYALSAKENHDTTALRDKPRTFMVSSSIFSTSVIEDSEPLT